MRGWSWVGLINVLAGLYLIASPFIYGVSDVTTTWVSIVTGIVVVLIALAAYFGMFGTRNAAWGWVSWGNVILGIWTIILPFVFGLVAGPLINWIITGIVILIIGLVNWFGTYRAGRPAL